MTAILFTLTVAALLVQQNTDVQSIARQGHALAEQGDYKGAEALLLEAKKLLDATAPGSAALAAVVNDLGEVYISQQRNTEGERELLQALAIQNSLPNPSPELTAEIKGNLATAYAQMQLWEQSQKEYREAQAVAEKADLKELLAALSLRLGMFYQARQDFANADQQYHRAADIQEKAPIETAEYGITLNQLASLYMEEGDKAAANKMLPKALRVLTKTIGANHPYTLRCHNLMAVFYFNDNQLDNAEQAFRELLAIYNAMPQPPAAELSENLDTLGSLLLKRGPALFAEAESFFLRALVIRAKVFGPHHSDTATTLLRLGRLYHLEGQLERAEPYYLVARSIFEQKNPNHPYGIILLTEHARNLWQLGRHREARDELISENRKLDTLWTRNLLSLDGIRRRTFLSEFDELLPVSLSVASGLIPEDPAGAAELAALAVATRKGIRSSAAQEIFSRVRQDRNPETLKALHNLAANTESLADAARKSSPDLSDLLDEEQKLEQKLIAVSSGYRDWVEAIEVDNVSSHVPADAAFLDIIRTSELNLALNEGIDHDKYGNPVDRDPHYLVIVYRLNAKPQLVSLGSSLLIDEAVRNLRRNFNNMWIEGKLISGPLFEENLKQTQADSASIYQSTFAKLISVLDGVKRLTISPDGSLAEVPWEMLRSSSGRYLIEDGYSITYLDSVRSLVFPPPSTEPRTAGVVIADVDYNGVKVGALPSAESSPDKVESPQGASDKPWSRLNGGREIVSALRELAPKLGSVRQLPLGAEEELKALRQPAAVVVHTHGFFHAGMKLTNEGLDSGIVLYGANLPNRVPQDGWLMAKEVMLLSFQGTRLVAFLGCDTGLGVEAGEGVQGLRHAISVAGARASLLTLWNVGDLSTARLFKEVLLRSAANPDSPLDVTLTASKLAFLHGEVRESGSSPRSNRWRHPYFWAAPTLAGRSAPLNFRISDFTGGS